MSDPRRWITSRSRGARRASHVRAAGADSEPRWHNARLDTPHPRLAPLGTPSPAPRRRGAGGAGDGPAAAPVGGHRGALAAFPALAGRTGHACVTRRVKHARPLQGTAVVGKVPVHDRQATVAERPASVGAQRASPVRPDRRGNRAVVDRPPPGPGIPHLASLEPGAASPGPCGREAVDKELTLAHRVRHTVPAREHEPATAPATTRVARPSAV